VTLQAWGAALAIVASSLLLGNALSLLGFGNRAVAPAVGMSSLIVLSAIAIRLPGRTTTSAVVVLLALVASVALTVKRLGRVTFPAVPLVVGALAAFGAAIPFIANGRVGLPGVSLDNDTAGHLIYAEALRSSTTRGIYGLPSGYPLGPHSLADTISSGLGIRLDLAFTGLLISIVIVTASVAAAGLQNEAAWRRVVVGVLGALVYLFAAFYAEGAFKELMIGLFLLAMVLHLEGVRARADAWSPDRWRDLVPVSLLVAGGIYVYSYPALAWFGLTLVIWLAAEVALDRRWLRRWRGRLRQLARPAAISIGLLLLLLAFSAHQIISFFRTVGVSPAGTGAITTANVGNLAHALSPYEAFGIWNSPDFRLFPANIFHAGELAAFALAVLVIGLARSLERRELLLPAAIAACALIYWRSSHTQSVYVTAKALVIPGPVIVVTGLRGLLRTPPTAVGWLLRLAALATGGAFVLLAGYSSYQVLRDQPVWPAESTQELLSLDTITRGNRVLFLGSDDYAEWLFHDSEVSELGNVSPSLGQAAPRPSKPWVYGSAVDFDSVDSSTLDRFRWVITTNTSYASQPPENFRLVRQLRMYRLWVRTGPGIARRIIEPSGAPGAILNCNTPAGRALSRQTGVASVMRAAPIVTQVSFLTPGATQQVSMPLARGRWDLSLQYVSAVALELSVAQNTWHMPAYVDRPGPFFSIGSVSSHGAPTTVTIHADRPSLITGPSLGPQTTELVATPGPDTREVIPLARSCGRYVDWYRLS
jgi:hypothetical protein